MTPATRETVLRSLRKELDWCIDRCKRPECNCEACRYYREQSAALESAITELEHGQPVEGDYQMETE